MKQSGSRFCAQTMLLTEPVGRCTAQGTSLQHLSPLAAFQRHVDSFAAAYSGLISGIVGGKMTRLYKEVSLLQAGSLDSPSEGRH